MHIRCLRIKAFNLNNPREREKESGDISSTERIIAVWPRAADREMDEKKRKRSSVYSTHWSDGPVQFGWLPRQTIR